MNEKIYHSLEMELSKSSKIIILPEYQKLKDEVEKFREELSIKFLERDELIYVTCVNIKNKYYLEIGIIEYNIYEKQCMLLRLKRKIELIQYKINRQEKIVISEIEKILEKEFESYQKRLNEYLKRINEALEYLNYKTLQDDEADEIKRKYFAIVKVLHPDINPKINEDQLNLFHKAVEAFENGDLITIRIIFEIVEKNKPYDLDTATMAYLLKERKKLLEYIKAVENMIEKYKSQFPYTMKAIVEDDVKLKERKNELNMILLNYEEAIEIYNNKVKDMLRRV